MKFEYFDLLWFKHYYVEAVIYIYWIEWIVSHLEISPNYQMHTTMQSAQDAKKIHKTKNDTNIFLHKKQLAITSSFVYKCV